MSDHFLRMVARATKFDNKDGHAQSKHMELMAKKSSGKVAPLSASRTAAALDFFGNAAPVAAAAASAASPASAAASAATPSKKGSKSSSSGNSTSGRKRSRTADSDDEDEEEITVKQEEGVEGEASEEEDEMVDDGENDLAEEEEASDDEAEEEEGVQLFGRTKGAATTDDGSDAEDADDSTSTSARVRALKSFRREAGIHVSGSDIPAPFREFSDLCAAGGALGVPEYMVKNLSRPVVEGGCGYEKPTAIQQQAVPILLKGRELLACAPTGSGKTAAFVIPILASLGKPGTVGFRALVLSPTRELAEQTHRCFTSVAAGRPFKIFHLNKANANSNNFGAQSNAKRDILITTPMRLVNLIQNEAIDLSHVEWLILDEADRLFELGFVEQVDTVMSACTHRGLRRALFSATMMQGVETLARTVLRDPIRLTIGARNAATSLIKQELMFVSSEEGKLLAFRQMLHAGLAIPVLIFVQSKERAQQLYNELVYENLQVDVIHADRTQHQRTESIKKFRAGTVWVLICTDLMARGIDFKGVNTVLNYDFPQSTVSYIHRIGRTGRAGRKGHAITFFTEADKPLLHSVAKLVQQSGSEVPEWMLKMNKIGTNKARKLKDQAPPRAAIVANPKAAAANKKSRDRKKKRKMEGKKEGAPAASAPVAGRVAPTSNKRKKNHNE